VALHAGMQAPTEGFPLLLPWEDADSRHVLVPATNGL
jgi:hypothetical protein